MNLEKITTITEYFRVNFNFFEPYEIILDGNFLKLLVEKNPPFFKKLEQLLNGKIFFKVTDCIISQLEILGEQFKFVYAEAKKQQRIRCRHVFGTTPKNCIQSLVENDNPKKYMVCSQDIQLRRDIREIMNVPIFYFGPDQRITMEDINKKNKQILAEQVKVKLLPKEHERQKIQGYKEQAKELEKEREKKQMEKWASLQGLKLPGKKARAPNPLSMKKKQKPEFSHSQGGLEKTKRIRKRKAKTTFAKTSNQEK